jgi:DUF4097 and DUF4098 domain-containing protein YvlB
MPKLHSTMPQRLAVGAFALSVLIVPWSLVRAGRATEERRPAAPQGSVEIVDLAGSIELSGWDRPEIEVAGTADEDVAGVDLKSTGDRTSIRVTPRSSGAWRDASSTRLVIHVPAKSTVSATLVSGDLKLSGVLGDVKLQTINGNVSGDAGGNLRASTVSGSVRMTARGAQTIEVKTINGDIQLASGAGEIEISTVSGNAKIDLGTLARGRFKSISGKLSASLSLAPGAQLEAESVSGTIGFDFPSVPAADFDVQSFSGSIDNCFGPKPVESSYGMGSRLTFRSGDGQARVRIETKSGDVHLCTGGVHREHVANAREAASKRWRDLLYVL